MPETDAGTVGPGATERLLARTGAAIRAALGRRDSLAVLAAATVGYLLIYLFTIGDLGFARGGGTSVVVASDLSRALAWEGYARFGAIAAVTVGGVTYLFSPLNLLIALVLSALVGVNLALTYLGVIQPKACGLEASGGVLASVPALLSGAACCGPTILLVVGIQASGILVTGFQLLVPLAVAMLVGSLLLIGRRVDPALV